MSVRSGVLAAVQFAETFHFSPLVTGLRYGSGHDGGQRGSRCEPATGWHIEELAGRGVDLAGFRADGMGVVRPRLLGGSLITPLQAADALAASASTRPLGRARRKWHAELARLREENIEDIRRQFGAAREGRKPGGRGALWTSEWHSGSSRHLRRNGASEKGQRAIGAMAQAIADAMQEARGRRFDR
jgi:hypothetical protein